MSSQGWPADEAAFWAALSDDSKIVHDRRYEAGAVAPPIYQTSLFTFADYEEMEARFKGMTTRPIYSRGDNPTVMELEGKVAELEGAEVARGFSSGMGAISAAILSQVKAGDRIVCVRHVYPDTYRFLERLLPRFDIKTQYVDGRDVDAVAAALPGARLLYLENPTSMVFDMQDLPRMAELARAHKVTTIIDNSWATPLNQQPIKHGIDMVVHSASKYISGHSDTVAGLLATSRARMAEVTDLSYPFLGAKLAPFEAWLLLRGLRTLPIRLKRHAETAEVLIAKLRAHPLVVKVHRPEVEKSRTLKAMSGLFSFELAPQVDVKRFCNALRLVRLGVSWGGHESLMVPALISSQQSGAANSIRDFGVPPQTVRLYVGLEAADDLWRDLSGAFSAAS
jgi:cystathionine beta-lyase/cystathionine gamma-synthase